MDGDDLNAYDWPLIGVSGRPDASSLKSISNSLGRSGTEPIIQARSWGELLATSATARPALGGFPFVTYKSTNRAPRLVRYIVYDGNSGVAIVPRGDGKEVVVLVGVEYKPALVIRCDFVVMDLFCAVRSERLFLLDGQGRSIHELSIASNRIQMIEQVAFELSLEYEALQVEHSALQRQVYEFSKSDYTAPERICLAQFQVREFLIAWTTGDSSLRAAEVEPAQAEKYTSKSTPTPRVFTAKGVQAKHLDFRELELRTLHSTFSQFEIGEVSVAPSVNALWVSDARHSQIAEVSLRDSVLQGEVAIGTADFERMSLCRSAGIEWLVHVNLPKYFDLSVESILDYLDDTLLFSNPTSKLTRRSIRQSLAARGLFVVREKGGKSIYAAARLGKTSVTSEIFSEMQRIPHAEGVGDRYTNIVQGHDEAFLFWSHNDDSFVEINPRFSLRASIFQEVLTLRKGIKNHKYNQSPTS